MKMLFKIMLLSFFCVSMIGFSSCEPEEPPVPQNKAKPYCYLENGKTVCYDYMK